MGDAKYTYKVIAAPTSGVKAKGRKTPTDRFAFALESLLQEMAADGWDFMRAETLPAQERKGLWGRQNQWHDVLVFRRESETSQAAAPLKADTDQTQPTLDADLSEEDAAEVVHRLRGIIPKR